MTTLDAQEANNRCAGAAVGGWDSDLDSDSDSDVGAGGYRSALIAE